MTRQHAGHRTLSDGCDTLTSSLLLNTSGDDVRADVSVSANEHNESQHVRRPDHAAECAHGRPDWLLVGAAIITLFATFVSRVKTRLFRFRNDELRSLCLVVGAIVE